MHKERYLQFKNISSNLRASKLFSDRYEITRVYKKDVLNLLTTKITKLLGSETKTELMATTYFEPVLSKNSKINSVLRFRQRQVINKLRFNKFIPPQKWIFQGPGNLEIKSKNTLQNYAKKMGTFLPDKKGQDIYALMKLTKNRSNYRREVVNFINSTNDRQLKGIEMNNANNRLYQIQAKAFLKVAEYLTPRITRVCVRKTYESPNYPNIKITLEKFPAFYPYPLDHRTHEDSLYRSSYRGILAEHSDRVKIEIKYTNKEFRKIIEQKLLKHFKNSQIPNNKETKIPYSKMVVEASKKYGSLIVEEAGHEIETKANLQKKTNLAQLMQKLRCEQINKKSPYRLFTTDPDITVRGEAELNRTIVGWQDNNGKWHEVVTIIRLDRESLTEYGYSTIIKWKSDNIRKFKKVLTRNQKYTYIKNWVCNSQILKMASRLTGKTLEIVGILKKIKYRIIVQNLEGRNFVISLDQCTSPNSSKILQQLEVEYYHTVLKNERSRPTSPLIESCEKCMRYFIKLLRSYNIPVEKTDFRKIDFAAINRKVGR